MLFPQGGRRHQGVVKLNCAGSLGADGGAGAGAILRNEEGAIIFFCAEGYTCAEILLEAEVSAFQEGLSMAIHRGNTQHRGAVCVVVTIHHGNPAPTASVVHQPVTRTYNFF